jgi:sodium-dependent dicarboxylate transporter 2/3/5
VLGIFITTALLWITKDLINNFQTIVKLDDTMIAVAGALGMFIASSGTGKNQKILEWQDTSKMAWGILLLFGGGITLAGQMEKAGLIEKMGQWLAGFAGSDVLLLVIAVTVISIFISEVMSNVAQVIVFAPVVSSLADTLHINPLLLGLPMTLAASCAGMLPMGTPPNAIVFASGKLKLSDMVKTGFVMNIISIVLITLFSWFLVPMIINAIH